MESHSVVYTAQELLTMLQGPALLQIMESPDDLRIALDCLDKATSLLASIEQCRYPGQAPIRQGKTRRPVDTASVQGPADRLRARIVTLVERWWEKEGRGATMREIRNPNRTVNPDDVAEAVMSLVNEGKLQEIRLERTTQYAPPRVGLAIDEPYRIEARLKIGGQFVDVYIITLHSTNRKKADGHELAAYTINRSKSLTRLYSDSNRLMDVSRDIIYLEGSKEYKEISDWLCITGWSKAYEVDFGYVVELPDEED